jgi:NADH-quinone oxidoreductase subunit G
MKAAEMVVSLTAFKSAGHDVADVMLPIAPFTETSGTYVNAEGRVQSMHGVVKPAGEARPAWKVLRVLGNLLGLQGFAFESADEVRAEAFEDLGSVAGRLDNAPAEAVPAAPSKNASAVPPARGLYERIADVPIYATDPVVRRASSLQLTADARPPVAGVSSALAQRLGLGVGDAVRVSLGGASVVLPAVVDPSLAAGVVRVPAGVAPTVALGPMFGSLDVEKVDAEALGERAEAALAASGDAAAHGPV